MLPQEKAFPYLKTLIDTPVEDVTILVNFQDADKEAKTTFNRELFKLLKTNDSLQHLNISAQDLFKG
jgi:hypothetical protein